MDYETKILFNRLIEAVDSPDGWTIALTTINTIAVIVIAGIQIWMQWQQTKLQKLQLKQQDYESNKELLILIKKIDKLITDFIYILYNTTNSKSYGTEDLSNLLERINELDVKLLNTTIDFELRFPNEKNIIDDYRTMTISMYLICRKFKEYISNDSIDTTIELDIDTEVKIRKWLIDENLKEGILLHVKDEKISDAISKSLDEFVVRKITILNKKYSDIIAERCKID